MTAGAQDGGIALTVYNQGTALIRDLRTLSLDAGVNSIVLGDMAETLDPTSVRLRSLSDPEGLVILEQSYFPDPGPISTLLARNLGETVSLTNSNGKQQTGELILIHDERAILRVAPDEVVILSLHNIRGLKLPNMPADIATSATLRMLVSSAPAGEQSAELTYLAGGMNWTADYHLILNDDRSAIDLSGMVTLRNQTGRAYNDARLKLVAGDVSRIETEEDYADERVMMSMAADASAPGVEQSEVFEYQVYEIARPVTISADETKQIEFVRGANIAAETNYVFDSSPHFSGYYRPIDYADSGDMRRVDIRSYLEFNTGAESGLGADLPAGRIRVYQEGADSALTLIGENHIDHTPNGEDLRIMLGKTFDLVGERTQTKFERVLRTVVEESFEIRLRNHKDDEAVEIIVPERLYRWSDWQIIESSAPFVKASSSSIEFVISVPPGEEAVLTYTVQYTFPREE